MARHITVFNTLNNGSSPLDLVAKELKIRPKSAFGSQALVLSPFKKIKIFLSYQKI
jgi:hypothetical protein